MGQLDASIVTLAFPSLQTEFGAGLASVQWVSLSYLAVLAVLLIPIGRLSDTQGRKLLYVHGFVVFTAASAACGFAPNLGWLVAGRVVQAIGAALLQANSVALVVGSVGIDKARTALGVQAAAQAVGLAVGPAVGGALIASLGWRAVFLINLPVGVVAVVAGLLLLPRTRHRDTATGTDIRGNVLLAVTVIAGLWALSLLAGADLHPVEILATSLVAVAAGWFFWRTESRAAAPLVPPERLRARGVGAGLVGALLGYLVLFAPLVLYPLLFSSWGVSTSRGGLVLTCLPAGFAVAAVVGGRIGYRIGNERRVVFGSLAAAAGALGQAFVWDRPVAVAVLLVLTGMSLGIVLPANNAMVMTSVPQSAAAATGGMINVARAAGTSLGVAVTSVGVAAAGILSLRSAPLVLAGLVVAALLMAITGRRGGRDEAEREGVEA
jgi:MFS family permease